MAPNQVRPNADPSIAERLERGEVVYYPTCPFPRPAGSDLQLLLEQRLANRAHKNISYDPASGRLGGCRPQATERVSRLREVFAGFSHGVSAWLRTVLPNYLTHGRLDQVSFRPEEEATRVLRLKARNDLLHVDAFPSRPTNGHRILRVFVNINPSEPRIWVTSDPFAKLLERFGAKVGLPQSEALGWMERLQQGVVRLFRPGRPQRSVYDSFMLRFHDFLKANDEFQEKGPKRFWTFPPGSAWLAITDTASHAVLRGRFALEHSYFIAPSGLALPNESPAALLSRACGMPVLDRAA